MIKSISGAIAHPTNRSLEEFHKYWAERHGALVAKSPYSLRYVQHHNLPEAFAAEPRPTHEVAISFYESIDVLRNPEPSPKLRDAIREDVDKELFDFFVRTARYGPPDVITLREAMAADDAQLFDRSPDWPLHHKRTAVLATEHVVVEGVTTPSMVKAIFTVARRPGLSLQEFFEHWLHVHGPIAAKLPGLRRYVQNHAIPEAYGFRDMTHDGFAELWFEDFAAFQSAVATPEWQTLALDAKTLFAGPAAVTIARELVKKG